VTSKIFNDKKRHAVSATAELLVFLRHGTVYCRPQFWYCAPSSNG